VKVDGIVKEQGENFNIFFGNHRPLHTPDLRSSSQFEIGNCKKRIRMFLFVSCFLFSWLLHAWDKKIAWSMVDMGILI
jgi:hypothetical protein